MNAMSRVFRYLCSSVFICGCFSLASAAPPTLTTLYPAGAQRGTTVAVSAAGAFDKWPVQGWASGHGVTIQAAKDKGKFNVAVAPDAVPGVYWLRAANADGASALRPFIVGTLPEAVEKEPNDEPRTAQTTVSSVVNGRLDKSGDVDCFAVSLKKGQTLVASLDANFTLKSPMDAVVQIVSADGFVLDQNHDLHGLDPQIAFAAPADGTYIARLFAFPSSPDSSIRFSGGESYIYRLTLTTGGFADYTVPLAVDRAKPESVAVVGWNIPDAARAVPVPATDSDFAAAFHPAIANPFRVRLEPHACFDIANQQIATPPFSVTARLDRAECAIPFEGKKGRTLALQAQSRSLGLAVNPVIRVFDAEKKQLVRAEPAAVGGDTALSFNPPADGKYVALVSDLHGGSGPRYSFLLRVLTPEPDYEVAVATDRFTVPPGKPLDVAVKVVRKNGFSKPVEIVAEGLPDGVTGAVKPPSGKPDPNAIVLTLSGEKAGLGGAFRLVGRVKDEPAFTRTARAPLTEYDTTTVDFWVAVSDAAPAAPPPKKKK